MSTVAAKSNTVGMHSNSFCRQPPEPALGPSAAYEHTPN